MATRIRLKRTGGKNDVHYRIDVFDEKSPRDGKSLETVGIYNPHATEAGHKATLKRERVIYWLDRGATPTETVRNILKSSGIHTN